MPDLLILFSGFAPNIDGVNSGYTNNRSPILLPKLIGESYVYASFCAGYKAGLSAGYVKREGTKLSWYNKDSAENQQNVSGQTYPYVTFFFNS